MRKLTNSIVLLIAVCTLAAIAAEAQELAPLPIAVFRGTFSDGCLVVAIRCTEGPEPVPHALWRPLAR